MTSVVQFVPKSELEAIEQVKAFIEHARNTYMGVIGLDMSDFDSPVWSFDMRVLGGKRVKGAHIKFVRYEEKVARGAAPPSPGQEMDGNFLEFAKALFLQKLSLGEYQLVSDLLITIKVLEYKVRMRLGDRAHPSKISKDDVIKTDKFLAQLAEKSAYRRAITLQSLVEIMNRYRLLDGPFDWKCSRPKPSELRLDISPEAEERREEKMPSQKAIRVFIQLAIWALEGSLANNIAALVIAQEQESKLRSADKYIEKDAPIILGLALDAMGLNCRISELALMPYNVASFTLSKGEKDSDGNAENEDRFALKWKPVKKGKEMVKPFSRNFAPFAKMIVSKLKQLSKEPRKLAEYYENNPNKLYLPKELEGLREQEWISLEDAVQIMGFGADSFPAWAKRNMVATRSVTGGKKLEYNFSDLERAVLRLLPKGFPYLIGDLKYSEAMFCCFLYQTQSDRGTCRVIPSHVKQPTFEHAITVRKTVDKHETIFERYGFYEEDGARIDLGTHEFRQFWQTQLKRAGVSELIAAYAAGRADVKQNEAYDLRTPSEMADLSFEIVNQSKESTFQQSALAIAHDVLESQVQRSSSGTKVISFSENSIVSFNKDTGALNVQGCHLTKLGICSHSYISSGCKQFNECLDCDELLCVKGIAQFEDNAEKVAMNLKALLEEYRQQLEEDVEDGVDGADQWLDKTKRQLAKLEYLIKEIYSNPKVPKGTVVKLTSAQENNSALAQTIISKIGNLIDRPMLTTTMPAAYGRIGND